jgi:hypothetical protein
MGCKMVGRVHMNSNFYGLFYWSAQQTNGTEACKNTRRHYYIDRTLDLAVTQCAGNRVWALHYKFSIQGRHEALEVT